MRASGFGLRSLSKCRNGAFNATSGVGTRASQTDEIGLSEICETIASDLIESSVELEAPQEKDMGDFDWVDTVQRKRQSDAHAPGCPFSWL